MTRASWERVKSICLAALDLAPSERSTFLEQECGGDAELRAEVESLIAQHDPGFLEDPLVSVERLVEGSPVDVPERWRSVGPYRLVRPVGRGGMGEVFLAIQQGEGFERPVALKVVRAGMATDDVLERFRQERRILASLDHPNLATLIDGGATDDGRPYFVMEYVEGLPITEYCDRHALSIPDRLRLFMSVCDAVQHAHQSLVVHRDIKPSNILVTRDGVPKLLDFGIGKVLDQGIGPQAGRTALTHRMLTPEYAAPEQVRGDAITTATDVHGLGVLLYELLTGHHPFATSRTTPDQLDHALLETTPTSPSVIVGQEWAERGKLCSPSEIARRRGTAPARLRRRLRGDLDNIVLQALRKEPERRYPSAESLRSDVQRHLDGLPVRARPDSVGYRVSKLVSRNPVGAAAAVVAVLAIGIAIVLPWRQNRRLTQERDKALAVESFLLEAFGTTGGDETIGARDLLDRQAARVDSVYADQPALMAQMLIVVSEAYDRLGLYEDALPPAERALEILRREHSGDDPDLAAALSLVGWAHHRVGEGERGVPYLEEAVAMRRRLGRGARAELARSLNDLGVVRATLGQSKEAAALHREALSIRRTVLGDSDLSTGVSASNLAAALYQLGDIDGAVDEAQLALELLRRSVGPDHQRTIIVQSNLAAFKVVAGDYEAAAEEYRDLLARQTRLQGPAHPITNQVRSGLATTLVRLGHWDEAEALAREVIRYSRAEGEAGLDRELIAISALADAYWAQKRHEESLQLLDDAIERAERARPGRPILAQLYDDRQIVEASIEDWGAAAADQRRSNAIHETRMGETGEPLARHRLRLAQLLVHSGALAEADSVLDLVRPVIATDSVSDATRNWYEASLDSLKTEG